MKKKGLLLLVSCLLICSPLAHAQQTVVVKINPVVGPKSLVLSSGSYVTAHQESFRVTLFQYYISNLRLVKSDGSEWVLPQDSSYFLIKSSEPVSGQIRLPNLPSGEYVGLKFMLGIDSLRNTMPLSRRKGCLDIGAEANGMYWSWNAGYIFFKLEGLSPQAPADKTSGKNEFTFHVGLYGGSKVPTPNNTRWVSLPFASQKLVVTGHTKAQISIQADVLKLFAGMHPIRIAQYPQVMMQPIASHIADNYANMFSLQGIKTSIK
jgi:hypothetical protein